MAVNIAIKEMRNGNHSYLSVASNMGDKFYSFTLPLYATKNRAMLNFVPSQDRAISCSTGYFVHESIPRLESLPCHTDELTDVYYSVIYYAIKKAMAGVGAENIRPTNVFLIHGDFVANSTSTSSQDEIYKAVTDRLSANYSVALLQTRELVTQMVSSLSDGQNKRSVVVNIKDGEYLISTFHNDTTEFLGRHGFHYNKDLCHYLYTKIENKRIVSSLAEANYPDDVLRQTVSSGVWHYNDRGLVVEPLIVAGINKINTELSAEMIGIIQNHTCKYKNLLDSVLFIIWDDLHADFIKFLLSEIENEKGVLFDKDLKTDYINFSALRFVESVVRYLAKTANQ